MSTLDTAAAAEIERLEQIVDSQSYNIAELAKHTNWLRQELYNSNRALDESERQRKALAEQLELLGKGGVEAAVGAGK